MKKIIISITSIILCIMILSGIGTYTLHRYYFEGAVQTYMNAQGIPEDKIIKRNVSFNWINMGQWQETANIKDNNKIYNYEYSMYWNNKNVSLIIYKNRNDVSYSKKLNYQLLHYDKKYDK